MVSKIKLIVLVFLVPSLVACSGIEIDNPIRNRANDYLYSSAIPPMEAPADAAIGELYIVPDVPITGLPLKAFSAPRPQPLSENLLEETVSIVSFSGKRWIAINKPPAEVWPRLRSILARSAVPTAKMDPPKGLLETGWLEFKDDEKYSHRFRFSISPGVGISSSEIRVTQMQALSGKENSAGEWPLDSVSPPREEEFSEIIANALSSDDNGSSVSLLAQNIGGESRVKIMVPEDSEPYIDLKLNYARSWNSVMDSLSLGGFSISSQHQSENHLLVEFIEIFVVAEDGSLMGLISGFLEQRKGDEVEEALKYKVSVVEGKESVEVRIRDMNGDPIQKLLSVKLLKIIRANLS